MIRYTNMKNRWVSRLIITIFVILILLISTPLRVTATRTVQIEKEINIEDDPRYDWDGRINYADENATTSWDEWQNFTNLTGAKGSFVGSLVRDTHIDLHQELIEGTDVVDDWTEYTDDVGDDFDWEINESVIRGYTGGDTLSGNRYSMQIPNDYNSTLLKTMSTDIMFNTTPTSYSTAGMFFDLNNVTGAGYGYLLIYDNDVSTTLGCYRYDGWESVASVVFSTIVPIYSATWYTLRIDFNDDYDHVWFYFNGTSRYDTDIVIDINKTVGLYVESTGTGIKPQSEILFRWFGAYYNPIFIATVVQFSPNEIMSGGSRWWMRTPISVNEEDLLNATHLNITLKVYHIQNARILNFTVDNVTKEYLPRQFSHSTLIVNETYDYMRPDTNTTLTENGHYIVDNRTYMEIKAPIFPITEEAYAFCFLINGSIPINISLNEADMGRDNIFLSFVDDGIDESIDYVIEADLGMSFLFTEGMRDGVTGENFNFSVDYVNNVILSGGSYPNPKYDGHRTNNVSDDHVGLVDKRFWRNATTVTGRSDPSIYNDSVFFIENKASKTYLTRYNLTEGTLVWSTEIRNAGSSLLTPSIDHNNDIIICPYFNIIKGVDMGGTVQWTYTSPYASGFAGGVYIYYSGADYYVIVQKNQTTCIDSSDGSQRWITRMSDSGGAFSENYNSTYFPPVVTSRSSGRVYVAHLTYPGAANYRTVIDRMRLTDGVIVNTRRETKIIDTYSDMLMDPCGKLYITFARETYFNDPSDYYMMRFKEDLSGYDWEKLGYYGPMAHYVESIYVSNMINPGTVDNNGTIDPLLGSIRYPGHSLVRVQDETGEIIWSYYIGDDMTAPLVIGGKVYVGSEDDGFIHVLDTFGKNLTRPVLDSDDDGMQDWWELYYDLDPFINNWTDDTDSDGIDNYYEYLTCTPPNSGTNTVDLYMLYNLQPNFVTKLIFESGGSSAMTWMAASHDTSTGNTSFGNDVHRLVIGSIGNITLWSDTFYDHGWTNFTIQFVSELRTDLNDYEHNYLTMMIPFVPRENVSDVDPIARINLTCLDPGITWQIEWIEEVNEYILVYTPIPDTAFGARTFFVNITIGFGIENSTLSQNLYFNYSAFIQGRVPVYGEIFNNDWFRIINGTDEKTIWFNYYHSLQGTYGAWEMMMPTVYAIYRTNLPADMVSQVHLAGVPIHIITVDSYTDAQGRTFTTADADQIYMIDDYDLFPPKTENDLHKATLWDGLKFIANKIWDALVKAFGPLWDKIVDFALAFGAFIWKIIQWIVEAIQFMAHLTLQILVGVISVLLFIAVVWILWRFFKLMRHMGKSINAEEASRWVEEQASFNNRMITYISMAILVVFSILGWVIGLIR